jgi:hypothetical protein
MGGKERVRPPEKQQASESFFSLLTPDLSRTLPLRRSALLVLTWTLGVGTPAWGHRFKEGDARPLTTCPLALPPPLA